MARPQTENLNAFDVEPVPWTPEGLPAGIGIRVLNEDDENGAVSAVLEFPAGWSWEGPGYCAASQEFFVLDGALRVGRHMLENGGFCYYPPGVLQGGWEAAAGCQLFAIFKDRPVFTAASESLEGARTDQTVEYLDSWAMDWIDPLTTSEPTEEFRPGLFVKVLRRDPETLVSTHLAGLMPGWYAEGIEVHPVREESIVISGDVNIGMVGGEPGYTVAVGGFYSRPAGIPHGPLSSKNGNVGLVHTDGMLGIDYHSHPDAERLITEHLRSYPWK